MVKKVKRRLFTSVTAVSLCKVVFDALVDLEEFKSLLAQGFRHQIIIAIEASLRRHHLSM